MNAVMRHCKTESNRIRSSERFELSTGWTIRIIGTHRSKRKKYAPQTILLLLSFVKSNW